MLKNKFRMIGAAAILLGGVLGAVALTTAQVGVPIPDSQAATIRGGSSCADRTYTDCTPSANCPDSAVWKYTHSCYGGQQCYYNNGSGGCGSSGTSCAIYGSKYQPNGTCN